MGSPREGSTNPEVGSGISSADAEIYEARPRGEVKGRGGDRMAGNRGPVLYWWEAELSREVDRIATELPLIFGAPGSSPFRWREILQQRVLLDREGVPGAVRQDAWSLRRIRASRQVLFFVKKLTEGGRISPPVPPPSFPSWEGGGRLGRYAAVFPGIIRDSVLAGASWLVNDERRLVRRYRGSAPAPGHGRMRAVEFRGHGSRSERGDQRPDRRTGKWLPAGLFQVGGGGRNLSPGRETTVRNR